MAVTTKKISALYTERVAKLVPYRGNPNAFVKLKKVKSPPKRKK
jgi:hypothetical protein|tara:strand:- start:301 stop:432 length:132 start_codon:yes stop_codon:yes gene_type:complete